MKIHKNDIFCRSSKNDFCLNGKIDSIFFLILLVHEPTETTT